MNFRSHLLITGLPGVGKTSLVTKVANNIKSLNENAIIYGFYTKEVRVNGERIGFDAIDINNTSSHNILARVNNRQNPNTNICGPQVGKYCVDIKSFESIAIPILTQSIKAISDNKSGSNKVVIIIDEIGKMEMLSDLFRRTIRQLFNMALNLNTVRILATIPLKCNDKLVQELKQRNDCNVIQVNKENRNEMVDDLVHMLCENSVK